MVSAKLVIAVIGMATKSIFLNRADKECLIRSDFSSRNQIENKTKKVKTTKDNRSPWVA